MVKECAICCEECEENDLHVVCPVCIAEDKQTCSKCWGKLVRIKGIHIDSPGLHITAKCPFCRGTIAQRTIIEHPISQTFHYYRSLYYQHILATQLLTMDRTDLLEAVRHFRYAPEAAPVIYSAWYSARRQRPTRLDEQVQAQHHNAASADARERVTGQTPPDGLDDWSNDTGVIRFPKA
jgi:hypothetical protein